MFVGHLAVALGAKKIEPRMPLAAGVAAAFGIDLLWPVLLLLGIETVRVAPGDTAFTHLAFDSYPWSHSLVAVLFWSALAALGARVILRNARVAGVLGLLVLSHWLLDALTHRPDLPLWPGGPLVGLGLWNSIPLTVLVEGSLFATAVWAFTTVTRPARRTGTLALASLIVLCTVIWLSGPWAPPPPSSTAVAWGALAMWLFVPWAVWIERNRRPVEGLETS